MAVVLFDPCRVFQSGDAEQLVSGQRGERRLDDIIGIHRHLSWEHGRVEASTVAELRPALRPRTQHLQRDARSAGLNRKVLREPGHERLGRQVRRPSRSIVKRHQRCHVDDGTAAARDHARKRLRQPHHGEDADSHMTL